MYFIGSNSPVEIYNHIHSKISYDNQFTPSQFSKPNPDYDSFPIELSQEHGNQITPTAIEAPGNFLSQVPETDTDHITLGRKNTLQTEPTYPEQKPFKPQKLPLILENKKARPPSSPGITMLTPSAYGKSWGRASFGAGLQSRARFTDTADGALGVGIGFGDAKKSVGLDVNIGVVDISSFEDGNISFKLHRQLPADFAVAVGVKNFVTFGDTDGGTSGYGVITKMFRLQDSNSKPFSRLYVSAGVGGGQFRSESDISNKIDSVGIFGSVALKIAQPVNAIVEWSGQDLALGLSVAPFKKIPLVITPGISDITGNAGDGTRFILGIGYSISF
ncbi:hypothetical protein H6G06_23005 [Anabaena sphaerica FACHB-251]|uniref:Uncharacterized protein n=1 Tax=Anabaena sphaerica FACHB-251 TaxID=2692883 RepID=A0A927A493_9NOST|nr:hypothetical protein [Anabaena sphaerica]MBD2296270.1 hypothetical protein [Anabaena sphaerica FACHB-251]